MLKRLVLLMIAAAAAMRLGACDGNGAGAYDQTRDVDPSLLSDAWGDNSQPEPPKQGYVPENAREDQVRAWERANWYREQSGLPPFDMLEPLNKATQAHCDYFVKHKAQYNSSGLSPHSENPAWAEGFTGAEFWERAQHFGYAAAAAEVIAFLHNAEPAIDGWMNTLYHRIPFMDASMVAMGYGAAGVGGWGPNATAIDTVDFGWSDVDGKSYNGPPVEGIYPPPGATGIPREFDGMESPQPPPPPGGYPSGTIISITWSTNAGFKVEEHKLWAEENQVELAHTWLDPSNDGNLAGSSTIAMYAHMPLDKGKHYWVFIKGEKNGAPYEKTWDFYTAQH